MRLPYHADTARWLAIHAQQGLWEYAEYIGNYDQKVHTHVEQGVMRWRTPDESRDWYAVAPTPEWNHVIHWDRKHDLMWVNTAEIMALYRKDAPWVEREEASGENKEDHYRQNAAHRIVQWHMYQDPYLHATEALRKQQQGYQRVADLLASDGLPFKHLWKIGLVRNRPTATRRWSGRGVSLQIHPWATPHLLLWQRWQDILVRPGQTERFKQLLHNLRSGRKPAPPWPA